MSYKLFFGTNWKMNKLRSQAGEYAERLGAFSRNELPENVQLFIIPPYTSIETAAGILSNSSVLVGVQNINDESFGPYTGEISAVMARDCGAGLVEIGHSDRRHMFGEQDEWINRKVHAALAEKMTALLCIGETSAEREFNTAKEYLSRQLKYGLKGVSSEQIPLLWVAYEPVWAIGTSGVPAEPEYVVMIHEFIRKTLVEMFGDNAVSVPILYGGSVNMENAGTYMSAKDVNGLFVGRSALDVENFIRLIISVLPNKQDT